MDLDERERNRRLYFKDLRKKQKQRRAERKRGEYERTNKEKDDAQLGGNQDFEPQASKNCTVTAAEKIDEMEVEVSAKKPRIVKDNAVDKKKAEEQCNRLQASKASQLVGNCSATTVDNGEKFEEPRSTKPVKRTQVAESESFLREIDRKLLKPLRKTIGSGTFGVCQLAEYRDWTVVVKEFRSRSGREDVKGEVLHEAKVIAKLGDHQGLPFLFGVQTKVKPYSIVLQFLGTKEHSLTVWRAAFKKKLSCDEWIRVLDSIAETLHHIHSKGYLHNDLKANNVVLEVRYGMQVNPVIIDFGKSTKINSPKLKKKTLSKSEQKIYRETYPHIAPEIVCGEATVSTASDVYSLAKLMEFICKKTDLNLGAKRLLLKNLALSENPVTRPQLTEFLLN